MFIPLLLIVLAALSAGVVAYGTHPGWGQFENGLQFIVWSRRLQWPLVTLSLALCLLLIALVILGKRRAWWLIGLGPILALFIHHFASFAPDRAGALAVIEDPPLVDAAEAHGLSDDDWVVGVNFAGGEYAYPYSCLFQSPVIVQTDRESRMVILWSAYANRVLAFRATDAVKARNFEVVSTPANAPLIYDCRHGQFINGLKGLTLDGKAPSGFGLPLRTTKTTWKQWHNSNPDGKVMTCSGASGRAGPTRPILPAWRMPGSRVGLPEADVARHVTVVGTYKPAVLETSDVTAAPINLIADGRQVLLFRPAPDAAPRAFDAALPGDPHAANAGNDPAHSSPAGQAHSAGSGPIPDTASSWFVRPGRDTRRLLAAHPQAAFVEINSNTVWTTDGLGVARTKSAGKHLQPYPVDDDVAWDVIKYWYPDLKVTSQPGP